jgi:hypothetical protein
MLLLDSFAIYRRHPPRFRKEFYTYEISTEISFFAKFHQKFRENAPVTLKKGLNIS